MHDLSFFSLYLSNESRRIPGHPLRSPPPSVFCSSRDNADENQLLITRLVSLFSEFDECRLLFYTQFRYVSFGYLFSVTLSMTSLFVFARLLGR